MHHITFKPKLAIILLITLMMQAFPLWSQDYLPAVPDKETSVYDKARLLTKNEAQALEQKLIRYSDTTSTQIVVITVKSLQGNNIDLYATELAHKWGIGQKGKDNGILLLVAKEDRKLTIRTGYGVEHLLTDALSKRIIENVITPRFKQGQFYAGIDKGTDAIFLIMNGEYEGEPYGEKREGNRPFVLIAVLFWIIIVILSRIGRHGGGRNNRGNRSGGFSLLDAIILSNAGRGGFGGGSFGGGSSGGGFSGGGFSGGFGGGGFGGGGASGGW